MAAPPPPAGFELEGAAPTPPPGFDLEAPPKTLMQRAGEAMETPLSIPIGGGMDVGPAGLKAGLNAASDLVQQGADALTSKVSEFGARAGNAVAKVSPTAGKLVARAGQAAGVALGVPPSTTSAALKEAAGFVPATVGDVVMLAATEGAGPAAEAVGLSAPAAKAVARTAAGALVGASGGHALGGGKFKTGAGAATGAAIAAMTPEAVRRLITETPMTEIQQRALASAKELGLPAFLDDVSNAPISSWLGNLLRTHSSTAGELGTLDVARAQALTAAKTNVLQALGPGGGSGEVGQQVAAEAAPRIAANDAKRLAEYVPERNKMTNPFPAPALPEERGALLRAGAAENQEAQNAARKGLYKVADAMLPPDKTAVRVPLTAPLAAEDVAGHSPLQAVQKIVDEVGQTAVGRRSPAYKIGADFLQGDDAQQEAVASLKSLLDAREKASADGLKNFNPAALKLLEQHKVSIDPFPPELRQAWSDRNLAAQRAQLGDRGVLAARADLAAQLPPEAVQALQTDGTMSLSKLDQHIADLGNSAETVGRYNGPNGPGDYNPVGRQLLRMRDYLSEARGNFLSEKFPAAAKAEQEADLFHGQYAKTFRNDKVQALYNSDPLGVFQRVVKSNDVDALKTLSQAVGPQGTAVLKRQLLEQHVLGDPTKIPTEAELLNNVAQVGPAFRTLFSPAEQQGVLKFAKTGDMPQFLQSAYEARLRALMDKPQQIVGQMLAQGGDVQLARAVKRYTSPATFQRVGRLVMDDVLTPSGAQPEAGAAGILKRLDGYSQPFLDTIFDPAAVRRARLIGQASQLLPGYGDLKALPTPAIPAVVFTHAGATISPKTVGRGLLRQAPGNAAMFFVGKDALMKMYQDPSLNGEKLLTTMLRLPDYDPRWADLLKRAAQGGYLQIHSALKPAAAPSGNAPPQ